MIGWHNYFAPGAVGPSCVGGAFRVRHVTPCNGSADESSHMVTPPPDCVSLTLRGSCRHKKRPESRTIGHPPPYTVTYLANFPGTDPGCAGLAPRGSFTHP